jgi:hypothetical protein
MPETTERPPANLPSQEGHARWCHPATHALIARESRDPDTGCIGRDLVTWIGDREVSGFWRQTEGEPPEFEAEIAPLKCRRFSIKDLHAIYGFLLGLNASKIDLMISFVRSAITDHDWEDPADIDEALREAADVRRRAWGASD